ncbi:hypothetical protein DNTS_005349 [Danionella cerebrum]|uniref:SAND domain-containing protein n=1 Tax=Danionella cerebrum TaxID=2873325 RepID=A0A553MQY0_9TELE|nr:hypothetical protein DNTS_005349 [Danionella translucida]
MAETEVTVSVGDILMMKNTEEEEVELDNQSKTQVRVEMQPITAGLAEVEAELLAVEREGINVKCVKYEDQLISPKQFVHMSGKATLKDWKRAIRMGGVMLRKMMDSGQLDFYQHSTLCTNTCRSTKFDLLINNARIPPDGSGLNTPITSTGQVSFRNGGSSVTVEEKKEDVISALEWPPEPSDKKDVSEISDETLSFWRGISEVGLMGEVVSNIRSELLGLLRGVQLRSDQSCLQDAALETQLEEQKMQQSLTWSSQSQALSTLVLPSSPPTKRPHKRPRLQRPASTTVLNTSIAQPLTLQPHQFTVISPLGLSSMGQSFTVSNLSPPPYTVTLPVGSQLFTRMADGKPEAITLHPTSGLTLLGTTAMQDHSQLGTVVSPIELVQLTQRASSTGVVQDGQVVTGTVVMQDGVMSVVQEEENQESNTMIEINPAAEDQNVSVMALQLQGEDAGDGTSEIDKVDEGKPEGTAVIQLDANSQFHNLPIMVVEEETGGTGKPK